MKFVNWISIGGLVGAILFFGNELVAQTDSLYNPFRMENVYVPYFPGLYQVLDFEPPARLKPDEAKKAIRKAFLDAGIDLQKDTFLKEVGFWVDGFNAKDKIGFVFLDGNMDETFMYDEDNFLRISGFGDFSLKGSIKAYENDSFLKEYYLEYMPNGVGFIPEFAQYIDTRFEDSLVKMVLISYTFQLERFENRYDDFYNKIVEAIENLKKQKSDKKFIKRFASIIEFLNHHDYLLHYDKVYKALKLDIINSFPPKKWMKNVQRLDEYYDIKFASMDEVREVENRTKAGTQFIAPIFRWDPMMIVFDNNTGIAVDHDLEKEKQSLYQDMELLPEEEKEEFREKIKEIDSKQWKVFKEAKEQFKQETLRKLEENVKIYIKWAKSQMGG